MKKFKTKTDSSIKLERSYDVGVHICKYVEFNNYICIPLHIDKYIAYKLNYTIIFINPGPRVVFSLYQQTKVNYFEEYAS